LASAEKTLLINKTENRREVNVNGTVVQLSPYEVRMMDTPANTGVNDRPTQTFSQINVLYSSSLPFLQIQPLSSASINIKVFNILGENIEEHHHFLNANTKNNISVFQNHRVLSSGIYVVVVHGLERPLVGKISLQK
jgi:hypothetical protein